MVGLLVVAMMMSVVPVVFADVVLLIVAVMARVVLVLAVVSVVIVMVMARVVPVLAVWWCRRCWWWRLWCF